MARQGYPARIHRIVGRAGYSAHTSRLVCGPSIHADTRFNAADPCSERSELDAGLRHPAHDGLHCFVALTLHLAVKAVDAQARDAVEAILSGDR